MHAQELNATSHGSKTLGNEWVSYTGYSLPLAGPLPSREFCKEFNSSVGEKNYKRHIYEWQEYVQFCLLADGTVLHDETNALVEDRQTIERIHGLRAEDREIVRARVAYAEGLAESLYNGDARALVAIRCAIAYCPGDIEPEVVGGIDFYAVGRNASHNFFMGLRNDGDKVACFRGSYTYDDNGSPEPLDYSEVREFQGYYGHH